MSVKSDSGAKFDKGKVDTILTLSSQLSDEDLHKVILKLIEIQTDRYNKFQKGNINTTTG